MKSKIFSSKFLKVSMKGNAWIPALLSIGFLLAFPVAMLLVIGEWSASELYTMEQMTLLYENLWRDGLMVTGFVVVAIASVLNAFNGFFYLYSQRKVDFYHSLPMKRSHMFVQKLWMGILYYLIPYAVMEFLAICIGAMRGYFSLSLMGMAVSMLVYHLLMYLLMYGAIVLVLCMTGNLLMGTLAGAALFLYCPVLSFMIRMYQEEFFDTVMNGSNYGIRRLLNVWGSPAAICESFLSAYCEKNYGKELIILLSVMILFLVSAFAAFMKRPVEKSGKALIYGFCEPVLKLLVTVPAGLGVGIIFKGMRETQGETVWWIFGMILGTVLAHGAMEILYQRDYRKFGAHLSQLLVCGALVAGLAASVKFDWMGFDSYLPSYEKLESISLNLDHLYTGDRTTGIQSVTEDGRYVRWIVDKNNNNVNYPVGMNQKIYGLLEEMVDQNEENIEKGKNLEESREGENISYLGIRYLLKSGQSVYREYTIFASWGEEFLQACYEEGTLKEYKYSFLKIDDQYLTRINGNFADNSYGGVFDREPDKREELMQALRADIADADPEVLTQVPCVNLGLEYEDIPLAEDTDDFTVRMHPGMDDYEYLLVYPGFKRTVALLEKNGYAMSLEDTMIDNIQVEIYNNQDEIYETVDFDQEEDIAQLKECLISYSLAPGWLQTDIFAAARVTGGQMNGESMRILWEKEPEFLKEIIEEKRN